MCSAANESTLIWLRPWVIFCSAHGRFFLITHGMDHNIWLCVGEIDNNSCCFVWLRIFPSYGKYSIFASFSELKSVFSITRGNSESNKAEMVYCISPTYEKTMKKGWIHTRTVNFILWRGSRCAQWYVSVRLTSRVTPEFHVRLQAVFKQYLATNMWHFLVTYAVISFL